MDNPKFQVRRATNNQYYFLLRARNGEIVLKASETYHTRQGCLNGIEAVRESAPYDSRYTRNNGYQIYSFNLRASNGRVLGNSETYQTSTVRENGIDAVKRNAPKAPVEDLA